MSWRARPAGRPATTPFMTSWLIIATTAGAIAISRPQIPACPGSRDTGAGLPLAAVRRQPRDPEPAGEPAVGHDRRARDRGGLVAGEEERYVRDLLGPEDAPERMLGGEIRS